MTSSTPPVTQPADPEVLLRVYRWRVIQALVATAVFGGFLVASALWPGAGIVRWVERAPWLLPGGFILLVVFQYAAFRAHRVGVETPEVQAILRDEWRRQATDRATRGALIVVLVAQVPLALLISRLPSARLPIGRFLGHLPTLRATLGMAVSTITLGVAAQMALFLFFDRDRG